MLDQGLVEDGSQGGIEFFLDVLQQHGCAELNGILQRAEEVGLLQVDDFEILSQTNTHTHTPHTNTNYIN